MNGKVYISRLSLNSRTYLYIYSLFFLLCFLVLLTTILPVGFSPDSENYYSYLNYEPYEYNFLIIEPLNWLIIYINRLFFFSNYHTFVAIYGFLFNTIMLSMIYKLYKHYRIEPILALSVFLFLFFPNYGLIQIRQGIVTALLFNAFFDVIYNNNKKFFFKYIIAIGFHYSAIVLFFILYISRIIKIKTSFAYILIPVSFFWSAYLPLIEVLKLFSEAIGGPIGYKLSNYILLLQIEGKNLSINVINPINLYSIFMLLNLFLFGYLYGKKFRKEIDKRIAFNLLFIGLVLWFSLAQFPVLSFRIFTPLSIISVYIISLNANKIKPREISSIVFLLIIVLLSINLYIRHASFDWTKIGIS
ncbi:MAG: hypothetical protein OD816_000622 [Thermodesulfobacterium sp.]|uniref:EpsG family protein n=1 Tax=Candidatus Thermodesulfobacterium syntrophicum TaxID=3060442 RepID=A0AAE3NZS3_9BACT|nr:hypothetical protein [Candidatus Thermodesulfobacterium syntrophicum]